MHGGFRSEVGKSPANEAKPHSIRAGVLGFRILGPLEVVDGDRRLSLGGAKQRALLAILILHRREAVSTDRLIDELWGEHPPATAAKALQGYVSGLRKALGTEALITRSGGYLLDAKPEQVDLDRFEQFSLEGRQALEGGDSERAAKTLREALALWRGPPLADFAYEPFAQAEIGRLEELRLTALEDRIDADLALGRHAALISEVEGQARQHPHRERLQAQLMLALYRSGRQADALDHYRQARESMVGELGIEPGPELQQLERAILAQDPELRAPSKPSVVERAAARTRLSTAALLIAAGGFLLLAVVILAGLISSDEGNPIDVAPNSVAVFDAPSGELLSDIPVGARPGDVSADRSSIWVANQDDDSISQIDPKTRRVVSTTAPGTAVDGLAAGDEGVWASDLRNSIAVHVNPEFRDVAAKVGISRFAPFGHADSPVAVGDNSVWVGNGNAAVMRIDPKRNAVRARIDVGNNPTAIAVGPSGVWVADNEDNTVTHIDPKSANAVTSTLPVGQGPGAIAVGEGAVWVANTQDDNVARIDAESGSVTATIPVGARPTAVAVGGGAVWVANSLSGTVSRIDPRTNEVVGSLETGEAPQSLVVSHNKVWASIQSKPSAPPQVEGSDRDIARVLLTRDPRDTDPALFAGDSERAYETCALLFNYPDRPSPGGSRLRPEVAEGQPAISDGGRTYTFTIRPGFRFSPPSNQAVTASAFKRAIERALSPQMQSLATTFMGDVAGAPAYIAGRTDRLAGVTAKGDQLVVRLTRPAPNLIVRLSTPWFCAVPPDTPITPHGVPDLPSAGPYYVASYDPDKSIVLRRNPNYDGPRPRHLAGIDYEIGVGPAQAVAQVEAGEADYYSNAIGAAGPGSSIPTAIQARLAAQFGPESEAARAGEQQYFTEPSLSAFYLMFNTRRPPFDDHRLRQAVNFALDRRALAREPFPSASGRPTDQYIPPGMPGFRDAAIYPLGTPNLRRARQLAGKAHRSAVLYTCNLPPCAQFAQIVAQNLAKIGIKVETKRFPIADLFDRMQTPGEPFDLAPWPYASDFPDPFDFINLQFGSQSPLPLFDDPVFDRQMGAVAQLAGARRYRAYARLDRDLAGRAAPAAAYASGTSVHFFSSRIGCQVNQPIYGIDLGRLCVRP
jgi:YVTN family beta-propeller protein